MLDDANNLSQHLYVAVMSVYVGKQKDYVIDTIEPTPFDVIKSVTIINSYLMYNIFIN